MKLKRLEVEGFGKLVKQVFDFSPGLNLIFGRNEAGKSTLQRSILVALYGFFDEGSITAAKKSVLFAYEPWDRQASFGIKLAFEVDGGRQYRVERTFAPKAETLLYDLKSGKNINSKFPSATQGRLFFAEELIGMPRDVFENTCLVRQAELAALEKSASAITDTLLRLSASASQESTSTQALEILEATLKEQIGTARSRNKPLPEAQRHLDVLKEARNRLLNNHQAVTNQMHELAQSEESFQKLQRERDKAEYQRLLAQRQVTQQQRQAIEQADREVERCQQLVSQHQVWVNFPAESQPRVQRLSAQYEKARSDAHQAEQSIRRVWQQLPVLYSQMESLHISLNSTRKPGPLPDLQSQSTGLAITALQNWLDEEMSSLRSAVQELQSALSARGEKMTGISQAGHEGITRDRQELGRLETELAQAKQAIQQVLQAADQAGIPESQWETLLSEAQTAVDKWQEWSNFPIHLRDESLQLIARYNQLREGLTTRSQEMSEAESQLARLQAQIDELQQQVSSLEHVREIPQQEKSRIQEISSQLENARQARAETQRQFEEVDQNFQKEMQEFALEKRYVEPLERLGIAGLNQLHQRWFNLTQQLASAQDRFSQSKDAWSKVGMPVNEFQRLESTVKEIQSGERPAPKPRRGCRSFIPMLKQASVIDQTPTEIAIYGQVQPIYAEYTRQQDEIKNIQALLLQVVDEIRQSLGPLASDVIQESTFTDLVQRLQAYQQKVFHVEQKRASWETFSSRLRQSEDHELQVRTRLENELKRFGFQIGDIQEALVQFLHACEQKDQLLTAEAALERIQSQAVVVRQQQDQFQAQHQSLSQIEEKLANLLAKAGIQNPTSLMEGIEQFEEGVQNYHQWHSASSRLEQVKQVTSDFGKRLSKAQSIIADKEENLLGLRRQIIGKYPELLPVDFTDQHLAQLDESLLAFKAAQSGVDKAQGQVEQLHLKVQTVQHNVDDWLEKEETAKRLSDETLQIIQSAGIEVDHLPLADALNSFEIAFQGFSQWQKAQREYEAAVQAQQAVHASLYELESEIASLETKIKQLGRQHPEWKNLTVSDKPEVYERNAQRLNDQVLQERDRMTRLQDAVKQNTKNLRHLAELDEEIDLVNAEAQRLASLGQALELSINELTVATREFQKMFAPRLEGIVECGLEQITAGRYRKVKVDPHSLNISILAPERDELVDTAFLSTGTRDLIYLVLRMGITQLMSNSGEKLPLLLDDPLVEFDALRQKAALEYLIDLSHQTQLFLFTKDENVRDWFQSNSSLEFRRYKSIELQ